MPWRFAIGGSTFQTHRGIPCLLKSNSEAPYKLLHLTQSSNEEDLNQNSSQRIL